MPLAEMKWAKRGRPRFRPVLKPGDVIYVRGGAEDKAGVWRAAPAAGDPGRAGRHGSLHRPRARHAGRLLVRGQRVQPRHAGVAAARFLVQALRLCGGARQRLHAVLGRSWTRRSRSQAGSDIWRPENYGGKFYGPSTLRTGIEQSRNVMTVRLAQDMGMPLVAEYSEALWHLRRAYARIFRCRSAPARRRCCGMVTAYAIDRQWRAQDQRRR